MWLTSPLCPVSGEWGCVCVQLSAMEQRCRSAVTEKNGLEEKFAESERARKASDKKMQQVRDDKELRTGRE